MLKTSEKPVFNQSLPVATGNNLHCAGYVQSSPIDTSNRIVGAVDEQHAFHFAQGKFIYINMGADKGVHVGDLFSVVRPKGQVDTKWTKKGRLGFYVQELGDVEVVAVKQNVSAVRVHNSCDSFLLGDLLLPVEKRSTETYKSRPEMDLFADPSGKSKGHIFLARDSQETITRDQIVYVDLGKDDNVQAGDYLTVYRKLGKGNLSKMPENPESVSARDYGYHSLE